MPDQDSAPEPRWNAERNCYELTATLPDGTRRTIRDKSKRQIQERYRTLLHGKPSETVDPEIEKHADALISAMLRNPRFIRALLHVVNEAAARQVQVSQQEPLAKAKGSYNTREAARYLGISLSSVERMIARGELRSTKIGGSRIISESALKEIADSLK